MTVEDPENIHALEKLEEKEGDPSLETHVLEKEIAISEDPPEID